MQDEDKKSVIVIPDVHGRRFWEDGVRARKPGETMIFLGDYTDPYPHEGIKHEVVPDILDEILEIPDTILLLGNHDFSYILSQAPKVRYDWDLDRSARIFNTFHKNHDRFKIAHIIKRPKDKNIIFSHAGMLKKMYHHWQGKKWNPCEVAEFYNKQWKNGGKLVDILNVSYERGGDYPCGSIIWADIREHISQRNIFWSHDYQIFGHTILVEGKLIKTSTFCMLDNQRPTRVIWRQDGKVPEFEVL